jgi:hypothetical protein
MYFGGTLSVISHSLIFVQRVLVVIIVIIIKIIIIIVWEKTVKFIAVNVLNKMM